MQKKRDCSLVEIKSKSAGLTVVTQYGRFLQGEKFARETFDLKQARLLRKAISQQAREERQRRRRLTRFVLDFARKHDVTVTPDLRVTGFRGSNDPASCKQGQAFLEKIVRDFQRNGMLTDEPIHRLKSGKKQSACASRNQVERLPEQSSAGSWPLVKESDQMAERPSAISTPVRLIATGSTLEIATDARELVGCGSSSDSDSETESDEPDFAGRASNQAPSPDVRHQARDNTEALFLEEIEALEARVRHWQTACEAAEKERHRAQALYRQAEAAFIARRREPTSELAGASARLARLLVNPHESITLSEALSLASVILADRIVVLSSAKDSAGKLDYVSKRGRRLLTLLLKLGTAYYDALVEKGDSVARKVFSPAEYSACESDAVKSGANRRSREFVYDGNAVCMEQHLRIGTSSDTSVTIRCYFAWIAQAGKIVIGHCGEHLPISSRI